MAGTYVTVANISNIHLKQFPTAVLQPYVDEANTHLEDIALQKGLLPAQLASTQTITVIRCLANYITMRFSEDSMASNNVEITDQDMYKVMKDEFKVLYEDLLKRITVELLMGVSYNSPLGRSISTGTLYRTA